MPTLREILIAPNGGGACGGVVAVIDTALRLTCAFVLWLTFLAMFLPTLANAVLRYAANTSLVWSVEMVQLTFPWFIAAGAALAAQHGRHIGVAVLLNALPAKAGRVLTAAVQAPVFAACCAILYVYTGQGIFEGGMAFAAGDVAFTSLGVPQSWSYSALLAGYGMLGISALTSAYRLLATKPGASA